MKTTSSNSNFAEMPKDYAGLVAMYPPGRFMERRMSKGSSKSSTRWRATT